MDATTRLDLEPVSSTAHQVHRYFEATAESFDGIYSSPRPLDRILRRDMYERFRRTVAECEPVRGKSVLDAGCGSGQYVVALAQRGAGEAVGLDFAQNMLRIATENARRAGVLKQCRFVRGEFLQHPFDHSFDYVLAVGVFDYIDDPVPFLRQARKLTNEKLIATFPRILTWRAPLRKVRLALKGCPVYFYTRGRVAHLLRQAGWNLQKLEVCGKIYLVTATPHDPTSRLG